ncbi:unnamed protein product [Rhizophagus irregularis]|nr:unnamed protein product [Rhizophagus irregularis]
MNKIFTILTLLLPKPLQLRIWRLFGSGYLDINVTNVSFKLIEKNKNGITSTSNLKLLGLYIFESRALIVKVHISEIKSKK